MAAKFEVDWAGYGNAFHLELQTHWKIKNFASFYVHFAVEIDGNVESAASPFSNFEGIEGGFAVAIHNLISKISILHFLNDFV